MTREGLREEQYQAAEQILGHEGGLALRELYCDFDDRLPAWFADLFDPQIGGFYYSPSAKLADGYLPDIESTVQAVRCLHALGLLGEAPSLREALPPSVVEGIIRFARSLQSPDDGFFYHPQWGKDITVSRRGRDLSWSVGILSDLHASPFYPTPLDRTADGNSTLPAHLCSVEAFERYLHAFDENESPYSIRHRSYPMGNLLQSQVLQIRAAGEAFTDRLFRFLAERQLSNGLWEEATSYESVNGLMKLALVYDACHVPMPRAAEGFMRALEMIHSPQMPTACVLVYNPWVCAASLIQTVRRTEGDAAADRLLSHLRAQAPSLLRTTKQKSDVFRKADGSFSYLPDRSSARSQGAPVAIPDTNEGDVNATSILTNGTPRSVCRALGIPVVRPYGKTDAERFLTALVRSHKGA